MRMNLKRIRLEGNGPPASVLGYEFATSLTAWGRFATADWPLSKGACTVRRLEVTVAGRCGTAIPRDRGRAIHRSRLRVP